MSLDISEWIFSGPASPDEIQQLETHLGVSLPSSYKQFVLTHGVGEGFVTEGFVRLDPIHELISLNEDYEVETLAPGLFLFGSNGAGEGFAFDLRSNPATIVLVPFIGMSLEDALPVGPDMASLFQYHLAFERRLA